MPYRKADFSSGDYYHVYNRGIASNKTFYRDENYHYFLRLCEKYQSKYQARMIAYCLMSNHFHLLLQQRGEIPISKFMQVTLNAYVQALNKQSDRKGPLFEGRFRHILIDKEEYLLHLVRYIHLNPVKAGLVKKPEEWPYSDYTGWVHSGKKEPFINEYFSGPDEYEKFVVEYKNENFNTELDKYFTD